MGCMSRKMRTVLKKEKSRRNGGMGDYSGNLISMYRRKVEKPAAA